MSDIRKYVDVVNEAMGYEQAVRSTIARIEQSHRIQPLRNKNDIVTAISALNRGQPYYNKQFMLDVIAGLKGKLGKVAQR